MEINKIPFIQNINSVKKESNTEQIENVTINQTSNTHEFIEKARKIHGETYDYSKVEYISAIDKVTIICKTHGEFLQQPSNHLSNKAGCNNCAIENRAENHKSNNDEFIEKARKIHGDKYDYSKVEYIDNSTKIIIICKEHREFLQRPNNHLNGQGCINCGIENTKLKLCGNTEEFIQTAKEILGDKEEEQIKIYLLLYEQEVLVRPLMRE